MKMKVFRCRICGDPYVGFEKPTNCPFCGAYSNYIVDAGNWVDENSEVEFNETSKRNLEKALEVEMSNASFYYCAAEHAQDKVCQSMFKALAKIEAEHASTISKILSIPKPDISKVNVSCKRNDLENIEESSRREERALEFYGKAAEEAEDERIGEVFSALVEIEKDHLNLDKIQKERLSS